MNLLAEISRRRIKEVLHFSTNRGLTGALHSRYLLSRPLLNEDSYLRHVIQLNSSVRLEESSFFDKSENWIDFVNMSISEVNGSFLRKSRFWHRDADLWWCILSFDPLIMTHDRVWFATTNNSYDECCRGRGKAGFDALFAPQVARKAAGYDGQPWMATRGLRPDHLPTCEQAEILYPKKLCLDHLKAVYVENEGHYARVAGWLRDFNYDGVRVVVQPNKFLGRKN